MPDPLKAFFVSDKTSLGKERATTKKERRDALLFCLDGPWAGRDLDTLERLDNAPSKKHGWAMWERA